MSVGAPDMEESASVVLGVNGRVPGAIAGEKPQENSGVALEKQESYLEALAAKENTGVSEVLNVGYIRQGVIRGGRQERQTALPDKGTFLFSRLEIVWYGSSGARQSRPYMSVVLISSIGTKFIGQPTGDFARRDGVLGVPRWRWWFQSPLVLPARFMNEYHPNSYTVQSTESI
jgi:hypothetical protein